MRDENDVRAGLAAGFAAGTLVLVERIDAAFVRAAFAAGASGILSRGASDAEIEAALTAIAGGLIVIDPAVRDGFARHDASDTPGEALTERETAVLRMLADGHSNRRIGERLGIAENTVKAHVASVFAKLGASTRAEAVANGLRRGLVPL